MKNEELKQRDKKTKRETGKKTKRKKDEKTERQKDRDLEHSMASEKVGDGEGGGGSIIKIFRSTEIVIIYAISNDYLLLKSGEAEEDCCEEN